MVDEEQHRCPLRTVVGVADPAFRLEAPSFAFAAKFNKLVCDCVAVDLSDAVESACIRWNRETHSRVAVFLAGEANPITVDSVLAN